MKGLTGYCQAVNLYIQVKVSFKKDAINMKFLFFDKAYVGGRWQENVRLGIQEGVVRSLDVGVEASGAEVVDGLAIPAMANVHSHAFQRGFAGLAEYKPAGQSDFWSWRQAMYAFSAKMTPEYLQAIAAELYLECLMAGYCHIGEFHYLHNAHLGQQGEMMQALLRAADEVGIGLTLLPAHYQSAGFDTKTLSSEQQAYFLSIEAMQTLRKETELNLGDRHRLGHCFHSLRAVPSDFMQEVLRGVTSGEPVHIHIAEQLLEVEECRAATGKRPVEWLLDNADVNENWCLIHATHMTADETSALASTGAVVGLCPTTEANLGDGIFPVGNYMSGGGRIAIGSDSHVCRNPLEELRLLEYSQRLSQRRRSVACNDSSPHVGTTLWTQAAMGGYSALGIKAGEIAEGYRADIIVLDPEHPALVVKPKKHIFDSLIFAGGEGAVNHVMVAGEWQVRDRYHHKQDEITERYAATMRELMT